jgi:hypothetical protein
MEEISSDGRQLMLTEPPANHEIDKVKTLVQLLSAVIDTKSKWPEGTKELKDQLKQMKIALEDNSSNEI